MLFCTVVATQDTQQRGIVHHTAGQPDTTTLAYRWGHDKQMQSSGTWEHSQLLILMWHALGWGCSIQCPAAC